MGLLSSFCLVVADEVLLDCIQEINSRFWFVLCVLEGLDGVVILRVGSVGSSLVGTSDCIDQMMFFFRFFHTRELTAFEDGKLTC